MDDNLFYFTQPIKRNASTVVPRAMIAFGTNATASIDSTRTRTIERGEARRITRTTMMAIDILNIILVVARDPTVVIAPTNTGIPIAALVIMMMNHASPNDLVATMLVGLPLIAAIVDQGILPAMKMTAMMTLIRTKIAAKTAMTKVPKSKSSKPPKNQRSGHRPFKRMGLPIPLIFARPCFTNPFRISSTIQRASCTTGTRNAPISDTTTRKRTHHSLWRFKR